MSSEDADQAESSLGAQSFCWFCHLAAYIFVFVICRLRVTGLTSYVMVDISDNIMKTKKWDWYVFFFQTVMIVP